MARTPERLDITKRRIVYEIVGMRDVPVERGLIYQEAPDALTMDVYYPRNGVEGTETPAVVFVNGYSDIGARTVLGCALKEMESFVSWYNSWRRQVWPLSSTKPAAILRRTPNRRSIIC